MKNVLFGFMLVSISQLAFAQYWGPNPTLAQKGQRDAQQATAKKAAKAQKPADQPAAQPAASAAAAPSALDQAIEEQVLQAQRNEAWRVHTAGVNGESPSKISSNPKDSREIYLNGQRFRLRKKERNYKVNADDDDDIHTYTNQTNNDTIQVYRRRNLFLEDGTGEPRWMNQGEDYRKTHPFQRTASESTKKNGIVDRIEACEETNPDGSCRYVVKRSIIDYTKARNFGNPTPGTVVVIKRNLYNNYSGPTPLRDLKRGTYQSLKNTNIQQTFGVNFKPTGRNDIYGPETYPD